MTPLDIILWALAAIIAVSALLVVAIGIWIAVAIVRNAAKRKREARTTVIAGTKPDRSTK